MLNKKLIILIVIFFSACTNIDNHVLCDSEVKKGNYYLGSKSGTYFIHDTFENAETQTLFTAHSGTYSCELKNNHMFGFNYNIKPVEPGDYFRFSVWRNKINPSGALVASAENANEFYVFQTKTFSFVDNWELLTLEINVPENINNLKVYVWNTKSKLPIYFDDLKIEYLGKANINSNYSENFIDARDGTNYKTIKLNSQLWMAQNLNYKLDELCYCFENKEFNCEEYGRLYEYNSAINACPEGWKLPSDSDWMELEKTIGMQPIEILKEDFRGNFESIHLRQFGKTGFDTKMAGIYGANFYNLGTSALFWTSTSINDSMSYCREISQNAGIGRFRDNKKMKFSVRCIKIE